MLFPTQEALKRAGNLSARAIGEAYETTTTADEREVAVSIVHGRQDQVGIYSLLTDCHRQAVTISRGVWALVAIGLLILFRLA